MTAADFREALGGQWECGDREIWGLVERGGRSLKIELLQASKWRCSVFVQGACVANGAHEDPLEAVRLALQVLDR